MVVGLVESACRGLAAYLGFWAPSGIYSQPTELTLDQHEELPLR